MATPIDKSKDISPNDKSSSIEDLFDSEGEQLSAVQYEKVLEKRVVFFSGANYKGCPMLCFPTSGLKYLEGEPPQWDDLDSTLTYMKPLLSAEQLTNGIVMLVDGRRPNQSSLVKQLLERISTNEFPLKCHTLFLLKASHLAQLSSFTYYFSKQKAKLTSPEVKEKINIVSIKDKDELFEHIPIDQLTDEFGGTLDYNHVQWFKNAVLYEKVQRLREKILIKFPDVRDGLNQFEIPQSIKDAERLMQQHLKLKEFFVNLFAEIDVLIDELTNNLLAQPLDTTHSVAAVVATLPSTDVLAYLNSTNLEAREEHAEFDKFWALHKQRLDHMMKVCHYKKSLEKVGFLMQAHINDMTDGTLSIGETLEIALELGEKHENFVSTCKEKMDGHLKDIREESVELCNLPTADGHSKEMLIQSIEGVKQGATSLTELYQKLMKLCQQKRDLYIVAVKFHMTVRQCDQWCASVNEFTEYPPSTDTTSADRAAEQIDQTDSLMKQMSQKNLNALRELGSCLPEKDVKKPVTKTMQKCKTSRDKLEEYRNKLLQIIALSYTPPTPPNLSPTKEPIVVNSLSSLSIVPSSPLSSNSLTANTATMSLTSSSISVGSDNTDAPNVTSPPSEYIDEESDPAILRKREFVYKEIVSTEKDYLNDLKIILDSYYYEMDPDDRVPLRLRGKRGVVFGNLEQIYEFHSEVFIKQIEHYNEHPERMGTCFIQHSEQFQLYSEYCRNRHNSEALLVQSPECKSFFKEIQIRLAHQLPLNSYLIKPIQRITKYQLLLKDMIKYSSNSGQALNDLKIAFDMMLKVLKNLNDSLHVVGLKGFPGALAEQGRLLVHDPFQVWEGAENSRHRLSRNRDRHVFMFEKVVIFTKKEVNQQKKDNKSDAYFYKSHLHLSDVRIKELPDDGPLVFGLSLIGGNRLTRLQASSKDIKQMWVSELKRLLNNQFGLLTDIVLQSGTLNRATAEKFSKARGTTPGKNKMLPEMYFEPKKSFSERFKLNILHKKKTSLDNDVKPHSPLSNKMSAPMTASLGGNAKLRIRDDNALTTSVPYSGKMRVRTKSHDDLLDSDSNNDTNSGVGGGDGENYYDTVYVPPGDSEWSDEEDDQDGGNSPVGTGGSDEYHYEILAPGMPRYYIATADYDPSDDDNGVPLTKGQEVELIGINQYSGWWWVRSCNYYSNDETEGWVPASFLQIAEYNN